MAANPPQRISPTTRRSRKLDLAKLTEPTSLDMEQLSKVERFKRLYDFDQKLANAGWKTTTDGSGKYYATIEKNGLIKSLTSEQCREFGVRNYSAEQAEFYADVSPCEPTEQVEASIQSGAKSHVSVGQSAADAEVASDKTVCSDVLRDTIPAVSHIDARNIQKFLSNTDGPIKFESLCVFSAWSIRVIADDFVGATLYVIANDDWSDLSCFTELSAAKSHFIEKVIISTRERIDREIDSKLNPPPAPAASGKNNDDIPF